MFDQKFVFSLFVFCLLVAMRQFHLIFFCFFDFLDWIFFLNGFSNPFIVHFRPSFLFEQIFYFSLVVFC